MASQKVTIKVPESYSRIERESIAQDVIDFIVERTREGKDKDNRSFTGSYSKGYKESLDFKLAGKSSTIDLTLSGDMLDSIQLLSARTKGEITIGFLPGKENDKAEGNILGSYGRSPDPSKARDFLGIDPESLSRILKKYPIEKETIRVESKSLKSILERIGIAATIKTS